MGPPVFFGNRNSSVLVIVVFWAVFYLWFGSEMYFGWKLRPQAGSSRHDGGSRWAVIGSIWAGVATGFAVAGALPAISFTSSVRILFAAGIALMLAGMALRWYSIRLLGRSFTYTVATRPGQEVVESGPYRWIRHPSYAGGLLTIVGILVCLANPLALACLAFPIAGYAYRIRVEERALARELGEPYRDYMRRTKRLVPFLV